MKTDIDLHKKCRCGHSYDNHRWEYNEPSYVSRWQVSSNEKRLNCSLCQCQKFNPPLSQKIFWVALGISIFAIAVIVKMFFQV